jgi:hypothetical protein
LHSNYQAEFPAERQVRYVNSINRRTGRLKSLRGFWGNAEIPFINFAQSQYFAIYELKLIFRDTLSDVQKELQFTEGWRSATRLDVLAELLAN